MVNCFHCLVITQRNLVENVAQIVDKEQRNIQMRFCMFCLDIVCLCVCVTQSLLHSAGGVFGYLKEARRASCHVYVSWEISFRFPRCSEVTLRLQIKQAFKIATRFFCIFISVVKCVSNFLFCNLCLLVTNDVCALFGKKIIASISFNLIAPSL